MKKEDLPQQCNKLIDVGKYCSLRAGFWYLHYGVICAYCGRHNYACGEQIIPDEDKNK